MDWHDIPEKITEWSQKLAGAARATRRAAAGVIASSHVGYYLDPEAGRAGLFAPLASRGDAGRCKAAAAAAGAGEVLFLSHQDLRDPEAAWVKVAHSPTLRRAGELLNFFPGQYPGGVPNSPGPVAAMLTAGLLGAGLGWGSGKLVGKLMPRNHGDRLGRTGLILGALLGAAPGAAWGLTNKLVGKDFNDNSLLNQRVTDPPGRDPSWVYGLNPEKSAALAGALAAVPVGERYARSLAAAEKWAAYAGAFGDFPAAQAPTPVDVDVNALGQTLWRSGASPQLAGTTMGAVYAARRMPDPRARPGLVTGHQLGQLAMNAAGDYAKGLLAGAALNAVVGTPWRPSAVGAGAAALGVIGAVVPKLFGG